MFRFFCLAFVADVEEIVSYYNYYIYLVHKEFDLFNVVESFVKKEKLNNRGSFV